MIGHPSLVIHPKSFTSCTNFPITCVGFTISKLVNCFGLCFAMPIDIMLFFALFTGATFAFLYL
jgi:hypothetical protein